MLYSRICLIMLMAGLIYLPAKSQTNSVKPSFKISGQVTKPLTLSTDDLAKMKRSTVVLKDRGGKNVNYRGVPLQDLLGLAGVPTGGTLRGENLAKYLLVKCADGYEVLFSLAEIDSSFTDKVIILADSTEGQPLPLDKGPFRLVVPNEKKPARSCFQVIEFVIKFASE